MARNFARCTVCVLSLCAWVGGGEEGGRQAGGEVRERGGEGARASHMHVPCVDLPFVQEDSGSGHAGRRLVEGEPSGVVVSGSGRSLPRKGRRRLRGGPFLAAGAEP